jgi:hypothetical protein
VELSGQLHSLASLPHERSPQYSFDRLGGPHSCPGHWNRKKSLAPARNWTLAVQPVVHHYTDWTIPAFCIHFIRIFWLSLLKRLPLHTGSAMVILVSPTMSEVFYQQPFRMHLFQNDPQKAYSLQHVIMKLSPHVLAHGQYSLHSPGSEGISDAFFAFSTVHSVLCCRQLVAGPLCPFSHPSHSWTYKPQTESLMLDIWQAWDSGKRCRYSNSGSQGSSVNIATGYGLEDQVGRSSSLSRFRNFLHVVWIDSGAHTTSYRMGARCSFPGGKAAEMWSWPLTSN